MAWLSAACAAKAASDDSATADSHCPPRFIAALLELHVLSCIACLLVVVLCPWSFVFVENQRITTLGTAATLEKRFFRRPCMTCAQLLRSSTRAM
jgi:Fe-S-cluster-containing hydrogenase component 2